MKKLVLLSLIFVLVPALAYGEDKGAATFRVDENKLGKLEFPAPESAAGKKYLGLSGQGTFTLADIKGGTVILEIFSMYCPICQGEAATVNELYHMIENHSRLRGKVKIIGVGTGNTPFEVEVFRKKYGVPFPLFADDGFTMQKTSADRIRTPTFLTLKIGQGKQPVVQDVHVGKLGDLRNIIKTLSESVAGK